jgi:hypothetical protein
MCIDSQRLHGTSSYDFWSKHMIMQRGIKRKAPILGVKTLASELTSYLAKMTAIDC